MRKMMSGLETVNAKPVRMSFLGEDCSWGVQCRFVAGFLRNMYTPNAYQLQDVLVAGEKFFDKGESEGGDYAIHEVGD